MRADRYVRRKKIVAQARQPGIKATARAFGCSRNTVRRWVRRYRPGHPRPTPGRVTWKPSIDCKKTSSSTARALPVAPSSGSRSPPTGATSTSPVPTVTNSGRLRSKSSANAIPSWIWPSPRGVHLTLPPNSVNTSPAILPRGVTIYLSIPNKPTATAASASSSRVSCGRATILCWHCSCPRVDLLAGKYREPLYVERPGN